MLVTIPEPLRGERVMLPVVAPPMVRVLFLRDWMTESPPRARPAPVATAETEAVGVPESILRTANLAEAVDTPPKSRSVVVFSVDRAPLAIVQ